MMIYHMTLLLSVVWVLLIFNEKQVYCGIVVVSSSSQFGTFCNGMRCPPGSSCAVSVNVINGNKTSDTRCSNFNGEVVRREIITVSNGVMCIKNLTMMGEKVNEEQSCRNLSKAETDDMEQKQIVMEAAMEEGSKLYKERMHELERDIKKKTEELEKQARAIGQRAKAEAEQLQARLAVMTKNLEARFG